jgi:hypothetical protein
VDSNYNQCSPILLAIVRDFSDSHPDFHHSGEQGKAGADLVTGMVAVDLGPDDKPVLGSNRFFSDHFSEWYNTIPNVNKEFVATIRLASYCVPKVIAWA